jgi:hypothetical protein
MTQQAAIASNVTVLFATRILRLFAYGFLSVILVLYLAAAGLTESEIGLWPASHHLLLDATRRIGPRGRSRGIGLPHGSRTSHDSDVGPPAVDLDARDAVATAG